MSVGFDCDGMEEVRGSNPLSSTDVRPSQRSNRALESAAEEFVVVTSGSLNFLLDRRDVVRGSADLMSIGRSFLR